MIVPVFLAKLSAPSVLSLSVAMGGLCEQLHPSVRAMDSWPLAIASDPVAHRPLLPELAGLTLRERKYQTVVQFSAPGCVLAHHEYQRPRAHNEPAPAS
jgi:hypothetical protein